MVSSVIRLYFNLVKIAIGLAIAGELGSAVKEVMFKAAKASRTGLISLSQLNSALTGN